MAISISAMPVDPGIRLRPTSIVSKEPIMAQMLKSESFDFRPLRDEPYDALTSFARTLALELSADELQIALARADGTAVPLYSQTCDVITDAQRQRFQFASDALMPRGTALSAWEMQTCPVGDVLVASFPSKAGNLTLSAFFLPIGRSCREHIGGRVQRLFPMIGSFFEIWGLSLSHRKAESVLTAAINHSDVPTLVVNEQCKLLFANDAALYLFEQDSGLRRSGDHLAGERLSDTLRLQAAIEHTLHEPGSACQASVVALHRHEKRALMAAIIACDKESRHVSVSEAIIYIFDPDRNICGLIEPVCCHYGLSPVETKLACLMATGLSLADIAVLLRVREHTARTYLKHIFMKTDTNRQAELVQLLLQSAIRTSSSKSRMVSDPSPNRV